MCGICGYTESENISKVDTIEKMCKSIKHRGPDNTGVYIVDNIALGHTRLSIRDLTLGSQPMTREIDGIKYTIVYNGELYNAEEIKEALVKLGYDFNTSCDTEVILMAYICYKEKCLDLFNGIYAFGILDESKGSIFLVRDRLGIKPLFYYHDPSNFVFGSEIKAILSSGKVKPIVGKEQVCEIFGLGPAHSPGKTFFRDIKEILPGWYGVYEDGKFQTHKYWDLKELECSDDFEQAKAMVKYLVTDSLNRQLISDVPVCTMLSGGLDSSILTSLANEKIKDMATFSIDFENNGDNFVSNEYQPTRDSEYIEKMVGLLHTNHTNLYFTNDDLFDSLKQAMVARDMPGMADIDSSMLQFCKQIKENGYKVAISGECSDEIFGGYPWYYKENLINSETFPWSRSIKLRKNILSKEISNQGELEDYICAAYEDTLKDNVFSGGADEVKFKKICYQTVKWFMNTLVERTDRMSMAYGLEVRVPFADHRIFEYVYNLSAKIKLGTCLNSGPVEKYILRKAFEDILPNEIVYRKKSPFPKTYDPKYMEMLETEIKRIINTSTAPLLQLIDVRFMYELLDTHGEGLKENWFGQLMTYPQTLAYLIQINMWLEEYKIEIDI